jgi:hypothetical protein
MLIAVSWWRQTAPSGGTGVWDPKTPKPHRDSIWFKKGEVLGDGFIVVKDSLRTASLHLLGIVRRPFAGR